MPTYAILAVAVNQANDRVTKARWRLVDAHANQWMGEEQVVEDHEVANAIAVGDAVLTIFQVDGHTVPGARVRRVVYPNGHEGIDTVDPHLHPGRTLLDLPKF